MTESTEPVPPTQPAEAVPPPYGAAPTEMVSPPAAAAAPYGYQAGAAPIGKIRGTGGCILLTIVTLGFYTWYWFYKVHSEMKAHSGQGLGGGLALLITILVSIVTPFITSAEVGGLYERRGQEKPVSGATGLWNFPGAMIIVGPIVWFVKTNGALNSYWRSVGATD
jgi:hypothetical protein